MVKHDSELVAPNGAMLKLMMLYYIASCSYRVFMGTVLILKGRKTFARSQHNLI